MLNRIGRMRDMAGVRLNLGCGDQHQDGSINVDLYGNPDLRADARNLPIRTSSVDWLETHHMMEHFTLNDGRKVLAEIGRVMKPGGKILITVPDLIKMLRFMEQTIDIFEIWPGIVMYIYGQESPGMGHLSAYNSKFLRFRLKEVGFKDFEVIDWPYRPTPSFGVIACRQ